MKITKLIIRHSGETPDEVIDVKPYSEISLSAYDTSIPDYTTHIKPGRVIVAVQLLPHGGELFIQTWDAATWAHCDARRQKEQTCTPATL